MNYTVKELLEIGLIAVKELHVQSKEIHFKLDFNPTELENAFKDKIKKIEKAESIEIRKN